MTEYTIHNGSRIPVFSVFFFFDALYFSRQIKRAGEAKSLASGSASDSGLIL